MGSTVSARVYRRRRFVAAVTAVFVLGSVGYSTAALSQPMPTATASITVPVVETSAAEQIAWPPVGRGALGAVGFDGVLSSSGGEDPFPIASITKVITSLVVLDHKPIAAGENGPKIEITDDDVRWLNDTIAEGGSWEEVVSGSVLTQRQVLEAMMLPSANNYSKTLVIWAFGSVDAFLEAAQTWLSKHGLSGTTLTNSSGLGASNVSTTRPPGRDRRVGAREPRSGERGVREDGDAARHRRDQEPEQPAGHGRHHGYEDRYRRCVGACILFSAEVPVGDTIVTVVGATLGAENARERNAALLEVIASAPSAFERVQLATAGEPVGTYSPEWVDGGTKSSDVVAGADASVLVWKGTTVTATATAKPLEGGDTGVTVGALDFTLSAAALDQGASISVPLTLADDLDAASPWYRLTNPGFSRLALAHLCGHGARSNMGQCTKHEPQHECRDAAHACGRRRVCATGSIRSFVVTHPAERDRARPEPAGQDAARPARRSRSAR